MSFMGKAGEEHGSRPGPLDLEQDAELELVLRNFRSSMHAWSEAVCNRPRTVLAVSRGKSWRLAATWALGCALLAAGISGGVYESHHRREVARIAAMREAEHQQQLAEQRAREEEELLAKVDSDISREVPSAMEPLARLMAEGETR